MRRVMPQPVESPQLVGVRIMQLRKQILEICYSDLPPSLKFVRIKSRQQRIVALKSLLTH